MFNFAENTIDMTAAEILNYYRNLFYAESQVTERGIVANAINDYFQEAAPRAEVDKLHEVIFKKEDLMQKIAEERNKYSDELEALKDTNEHLAVMLEEAKETIGRNAQTALEVTLDEIEKAKAEVAEKIFWEIDKLLTIVYTDDEDGRKFIGVDMQKYYSLKKKYTEGQK